MAFIEKIVSGGQTGADRAALDFAIEHGISHGGWCPRNREAEDGVIESRYRLTETPDSHYFQRTEWNVRDSDGTLLFSLAPILRGGSRKTAELARARGKPILHISLAADLATSGRQVLNFVREHHLKILNVAGSRASEEPGIYTFSKQVLTEALAAAQHDRKLS